MSKLLAEILGIMLGDGCLYKDSRNKYQTIVTLHLQEEQYAHYVKTIFKKFFEGYSFTIFKKKDHLRIVNTSVHVGSELIKAGFLSGDKISNNLTVPSWVFSNKQFQMSLLRGLFDTDGCIYRKYAHYLQIQFKFANKYLITDSRRILINLGFHPTKIQKEVCRGKLAWKFYLSRQNEILLFFEKVLPANTKHLFRFNSFQTQNPFK